MNQLSQQPPKVSIIIPMYNTAEYVYEALTSIMEQTLQEIEIIVVNDGSTDQSPNIVRELSEKDPRIQLIHQENQGQSVARNQGIARATGTYLYFMDSDDVLHKEALSACYACCERDTLDFVFFNAEILNKDNSFSKALNYERGQGNIQENQVYPGEEVFELQLSSSSYSASPCLSLIRTAFITRNHFRFYPGIIHEDELFTTLLYLRARRVGFLNQSFFKRRFRSDSVMTRTFSRRNIEGYFTVADQLLDVRQSQSGHTQQLIDTFLSRTLNAAVWEAWVMPFGERMYVLKKCLTRYRKYLSVRTLAVLVCKPIKSAFP
ncbi:MAG: glycosyltransferase [Bacteroides sp.]|nr:glycosyltransferase [Bacteroides sp.]